MNSAYVVAFLDHIYIDRENTAQTRDNYLSWLRQFSTFLLQQQYVNVKPTEGIPVLGKNLVLPDQLLAVNN